MVRVTSVTLAIGWQGMGHVQQASGHLHASLVLLTSSEAPS